MTVIKYANQAEAWSSVIPRIEKLILSGGYRRVVEIGGGANPAFNLDFVQSNGIEYTVLDISQSELAKSPPGYRKLCADICDERQIEGMGEFDFVFSRMLAEHVPDGCVFHKNVHRLLRTGGVAFHFFPTLYAFPFVINRLMPERISRLVLSLLQPGRESHGKTAKFPAYYSWCRGPLHGQISRLQKLGYSVDEYLGFFGHDPYYQKMRPLLWLHQRLSAVLQRHQLAAFTSFAQLTVRKL